jgi:hypothetical protein
MENLKYTNWYKSIVWTKDSIILVNGNRILKNSYVTQDGFDSNSFNKMLKELYLEKYAK